MRGVAEHGAAGLDDEDLALVEADVGRGAAQRADRRRVIGSMQDHVGRGHSVGLSKSIQHGHLRRQAVIGLAQHHAARAVQQAVGEATLRRTGRQCISRQSARAPANHGSLKAPVLERAARRGIRGLIAVVRGAAPLLRRTPRARPRGPRAIRGFAHASRRTRRPRAAPCP